jgi:PhnB protein
MTVILDPYLTFGGNCSEAMHFYAEVLGGEILHEQTFGETPGCEDMGPEVAKQTMHIAVRLGDRTLMGSDCGTMPFNGRQGISLSLGYPTPEEGRRVFERLAEGGKVTMPLEETFWVECFGMCEDRFGTAWMVNAGKNKM